LESTSIPEAVAGYKRYWSWRVLGDDALVGCYLPAGLVYVVHLGRFSPVWYPAAVAIMVNTERLLTPMMSSRLIGYRFPVVRFRVPQGLSSMDRWGYAWLLVLRASSDSVALLAIEPC
jgi:hypothetical protein